LFPPATRITLTNQSHNTSTFPRHAPSLHDALPISFPGVDAKSKRSSALILGLIVVLVLLGAGGVGGYFMLRPSPVVVTNGSASTDRKSTRLNSSQVAISYDVCCLNKKADTVC